MRVVDNPALRSWKAAVGSGARERLLQLIEAILPKEILAGLSQSFTGKKLAALPVLLSFAEADDDDELVYASDIIFSNVAYDDARLDDKVYCVRFESSAESADQLKVSLVIADKKLLMSEQEYEYDSPTDRGRENPLVMRVEIDFSTKKIIFTDRGVSYHLRRQGHMTKLSVRLLKGLRPLLGNAWVSNNSAHDIGTMLFFELDTRKRAEIKAAYRCMAPANLAKAAYDRAIYECGGDFKKIPGDVKRQLFLASNECEEAITAFRIYRHAYSGRLDDLVAFHESRCRLALVDNPSRLKPQYESKADNLSSDSVRPVVVDNPLHTAMAMLADRFVVKHSDARDSNEYEAVSDGQVSVTSPKC
jgi:hypothetical protein